MPTHRLGPGTQNLSANVPMSMAALFRRLAFVSNQSASARVRQLIERDLAEARARGLQLARDARQMLLPLTLCCVVAAGIASVLAAAVVGASELRRPAITRTIRTVRGLKLRHRREQDESCSA